MFALICTVVFARILKKSEIVFYQHLSKAGIKHKTASGGTDAAHRARNARAAARAIGCTLSLYPPYFQSAF
jgi:hypothetical protein